MILHSYSLRYRTIQGKFTTQFQLSYKAQDQVIVPLEFSILRI